MLIFLSSKLEWLEKSTLEGLLNWVIKAFSLFVIASLALAGKLGFLRAELKPATCPARTPLYIPVPSLIDSEGISVFW